MKIDRTTSKRIRAKIQMLASDPGAFANNIRKLKGSGELMRLRIGNWRVIYADSGVILSIAAISPRGSAYD